MPNYRKLARQAAIANGINPSWFERQINQESGFQVAPSGRDSSGRILPNSSGAVGIAQVVPKYHPDAPGPDDPVGQIQWAAKHMGTLFKKYGSMEKALSVYNSGRADAYLDPNFAKGQTYNYVRNIMGRARPAGSSSGRTPGAEPGSGGSTPSPAATPVEIMARAAENTGADQVRAQAQQNLRDIASGRLEPTEALGNIPALIRTLHASIPKIQAPAPPAPGQPGGGALEQQAVALARKYIGVKYTWGGTTVETGFDCSGLIQTIWKSLGVSVPRTTYEQWDAGKNVSATELRPGDAVFFTGSDPKNGKPGHEGLYIGDGKFIEAPGRGKHVRIATLANRSDFVGGRRFG